MTAPAFRRPACVLARHSEWTLDLENVRSDELKPAARFWVGPKAPTRKADCQAAISRVLANPIELQLRIDGLSHVEREILGIFKRYGGTISGSLLRTEMLTRGLIELPKEGRGYLGYTERRNDPYFDLGNKFVVQSTAHRGFYSSYSYGYGNTYPESVANPAVLARIEESKPTPWQPTPTAKKPCETSSCPFAEIVLNLWMVAQELEKNNGWKPTRGGGLPKSLANKLVKILPTDPVGPPSVLDTPALYYELLRGLGVVLIETTQGRVDLSRLQNQLDKPAETLAQKLVQSWQLTAVWQDGLGTVPGRDNDYESVRIRPNELIAVRELLVWGLGTLARTEEWFDLEIFLGQLWEVQRDETPKFYFGGFAWEPQFAEVANKARLDVGPTRSRAFWLDDVGAWAANAILGTLVHLGLVERGPVTERGPFTFRPTPLGRVVFGAPEIPSLPPAVDARFFTVQANFDVVVYLNDAPPGAIWPLARITRRTTTGGNPVQTFAIDRSSVYSALEGGFTTDRIRDYLVAHTRNPLPANVVRSLEEWGGKRESLVLRRGVSLLTGVATLPKNARLVSEGFHLLSSSSPQPKGVPVITYPDRTRPCFETNEDGVVRLESDADLVAVARLCLFADRTQTGCCEISATSVAGAKRRGFSAEQILTRLRQHNRGAVPPLLEVAIRNWHGGGRVVLDTLLMMRVADATTAAAILGSERFQPYLVLHLPPTWFVVDGKRRKELERLLAGIGCTWTIELPPNA